MSPALPRRSRATGQDGRYDPWWVALAAFVSRLPYLTPFEQDLDGSRFVRGVLGFDLVHHHPHPPGYPVYMGAATALDRALLHQPALSLSVVSAVGFALLAGVACALARVLCDPPAAPDAPAPDAPAPDARAPDARAPDDDVPAAPPASRLAPRVAGLVAPALLALGTSVAVHSTRPLSDMLGAALGWACVLAAAVATRAPAHSSPRAARTAALAGVALFALLCGARPSVVPLALPALGACARVAWRQGRARAALVAGAVTTAAWLLPLLAVVGAGAWVRLTLGQTAGHFTEFGGSAVTDPDVRARAVATAFGLWAHVLGGAWSDRAAALWVSSVATVALLALGAGPLVQRVRAPDGSPARVVVLAAGLYAAWAYLGQNVLWQPRHVMPLAPLFAVTGALGAARVGTRARASGPRAAALGALACLAFAPLAREALRVMRLQARVPPPAVRLAEVVAREVPTAGTLVASRQLPDWLRFHAPLHRVLYVRDAREALSLGARAGLAVFATSEVPGAWDAVPPPREIARATSDRYVCSALYDLSLLRLAPPDPPR